MVNPAWLDAHGLTPEGARGHDLPQDPRSDAGGPRALLDRTVRDGEVVRTPPIRQGSGRWIETVGFPIKDGQGRIEEAVLLGQDVTERVEAEERERLLAREVDHRAKNVLAVVQAVVELTRAEDIAGFKAAVGGRIRSLARAHSLLAASRWEGVDIGQLAADELAPFDRPGQGRSRIDGPSLTLRPAAAQALGLVLHELATNAAKHGALSVPDGSVEVAWRERDGRFELRWHERGGPATEPPKRRGFGSMLIRQSIERQLGGELHLDWRPEGLVAVVTLPSDQLIASEASHPIRPAASAPAARPGSLAGQRVLVVEDEALISLQLAELVTELGARVVGPAATVAEALALVASGGMDAAVLDVNLGGERSDPVAHALSEAGVPFVVSTGYGEEMDLPPPLERARRLGKPIGPAVLAEALSALVVGGRRIPDLPLTREASPPPG